MNKEFDYLVFIGRFQPLHVGHEKVIQEAFKLARNVIILIGSSNRAISIQNPFTFSERMAMLSNADCSFYYQTFDGRLIIKPLNDYLYNDPAWVSAVQRIVSKEIATSHYASNDKIGIIGFSKDATSYYLKMFPQWGAIEIPSQHSTFNSTDIRNAYFQSLPHLPGAVCSEGVNKFLIDYMYTDNFKILVKEAEENKKYKKAWASAPFPPTFNTVDNVVIQGGHILLIERGDYPGKGLLAFPGGFINSDEFLIDSAIRELKEETKISDDKGEIPPGKLRSFIKDRKTFDDPRRSTRGRTITEAFLYDVPASEKLYKVKGSDDAAKAAWYPIGTVPANQFFEDHYYILCKMLGLTMD